MPSYQLYPNSEKTQLAKFGFPTLDLGRNENTKRGMEDEHYAKRVCELLAEKQMLDHYLWTPF